MGGNGSYVPQLGGIPIKSRQWHAMDEKIDGHKIIFFGKGSQNKTPVNSNTENTIYLCAKIDKHNGTVSIHDIGFYENHKIIRQINIKYDTNGNYIPFGTKEGSHCHYFDDNKAINQLGRETHNPKNTYPLSKEDISLIKKIVEFNKQRKIWNVK